MATYTSTTSGLWSAGSTWVGGVKPPSAGNHKIIIATGHVVEYDEADGEYGDDTVTGIEVFGTLTVSRSMSTKLTCVGTLLIRNGGSLQWGTESNPIPSTYTSEIVINKSASMANQKYLLQTEQSDSVLWSSFEMCGAEKVPSAKVVSVTDSTTFVMDDITGWEIGDALVLEPSTVVSYNVVSFNHIANIDGNTITLDMPITPANYNSGMVFGNLTRNVKVYPYGTTYSSLTLIQSPNNASFNGILNVRNVEFEGNGDTSNIYYYGALDIYYRSTSFEYPVHTVHGCSVHTIVNFPTGTTTPTYRTNITSPGISIWTGSNNNLTIEDSLVVSRWGASSRGYGIYVANGAAVKLDRISIFGSNPAILTQYSQGAININLDSSRLIGCDTIITSVSIKGIIKNTLFRRVNYVANNYTAMAKLIFDNCDFEYIDGSLGANGSFSLNAATYADALFVGCRFTQPLSIGTAVTSNISKFLSGCLIKFKDIDNDNTKQLALVRGASITRDNSTIYRSPSSMAFTTYSTTPAVFEEQFILSANQVAKIVGYIRYNTTHGTSTTPVISFTIAGEASESFTTPASADTWHKFEFNLTNPNNYPTICTIEYTDTSSGAGSISYLSGLPMLDFVDSNRHYGYVSSSNKYLTLDDCVTELDESVVASYVSIDDLSQFYDRCTLWDSDNPQDERLATCNNGEITVANNDILFDGTASSVFDVGMGMIVVKTTTIEASDLYSSIKVIKTSGTINFINGAAPGASLIYEDSNGRSVAITAPNLPDGTRVQIWDVNADTQVDNTIVTGGLGYFGRMVWTENKPIRIRATYCDGDSAMLPITSTINLTSDGAEFVDSFEVDTIYAANAEDGSLINEFIADYPNVQVDINDDVTTVKRLYAWFRFIETTYDGVANWFKGITAEDTVNYRINTDVLDLTLDNTEVSPVRIIDGRLYRSDGSTVINASSGSIQMDPDKVYVRVVETPTSGLTVDESAKLLSLDTTNLDVAVSTRSTADDINNAINAQTTNIKGADNKDLTEVFNNTVSVDLTPVINAIDNLNDFDPANDVVAHVTLVDVTTTNTDMRGTDNANTVVPDNASITAIKTQTDKLTFTGTDVKATLDGEVINVSVEQTGLAQQSTLDEVLEIVTNDYDIDQNTNELVGRIYDGTPKIYTNPIFGGTYVKPLNAPNPNTPGLR